MVLYGYMKDWVKDLMELRYELEVIDFMKHKRLPMFYIVIASTNQFYHQTAPDGTCGYRVLWQAERRAMQRFVVSNLSRDGVKDVDYRGWNDNETKDYVKWLGHTLMTRIDIHDRLNQSALDEELTQSQRRMRMRKHVIIGRCRLAVIKVTEWVKMRMEKAETGDIDMMGRFYEASTICRPREEETNWFAQEYLPILANPAHTYAMFTENSDLRRVNSQCNYQLVITNKCDGVLPIPLFTYQQAVRMFNDCNLIGLYKTHFFLLPSRDYTQVIYEAVRKLSRATIRTLHGESPIVPREHVILTGSY